MFAPSWRTVAAAGMLTGVLWGCAPQARIPLRPIAQERTAEATEPTNAYRKAAEAALNAEAAVGDKGKRSRFSQSLRERLLPKLRPAMRLAEQSLNGEYEPAYSPSVPEAQDPNHNGWRLIGAAYRWKIEAALEKESFSDAAQNAGKLARFGARIAEGDSRDLSLGLSLLGSARDLMAPHLSKLDAASLESLSSDFTRALADLPTIDGVLARQSDCVALGLQSIQDDHAAGRHQALIERLGPRSAKAVRQMERLSDLEAAQFFDGMAADAIAQAEFLRDQAQYAVSMREEEDRPRQQWSALSRHYTRTLDATLETYDLQVTKCRLFVLNCRVEGHVRIAGSPPVDLAAAPKNLRIDPYSGEEFGYRTAEAAYRIYSCGDDGRYDGGESDESGMAPDIVLR